LLAAAVAAPVESAQATEGAVGRTILGSQMLARPGVIAPLELTAVSVTSFYFAGDLGASVQVPNAGLVTADAEGKASFTPITILKVWKVDGDWSFGSALTMPLLWVQSTATISGAPGSLRVRQSNFGIYDLGFTPIIAGHRFTQLDQMSFKLTVFAPTGSYQAGRLNNLGANYWTVVPSIAATKLSADRSVELSGQLQLHVNSRNKATNYKTAPALTFDALASKSFQSGLGVGVILSLVQQLSKDEGPLADRLNGFQGRDFGIGPYASYSTKVAGQVPLDFTLRWVPSFTSKNRLAGNTVLLTASMPIAVKMPAAATPAAP
jgi:hypothetical protein